MPEQNTTPVISREEAEEFTQALGQVLGGGWRLIFHAYRQGIPAALGLTTRDWAEQRLGGYIRLPIEERREAVAELTEGEGLSTREAAEVLGVGKSTVERDKQGGPNGATEESEQIELAESAGPNGTPLGKPHVAQATGENEWFTPPEYIEVARLVMGGIDLDPASCEVANRIVKAETFYTKDNDGLTQPWFGRVWMNPPYSQPLIGKFTDKLVENIEAGNVEQACVLVNNATETAWFQPMLKTCSAVCFIQGRVKFLDVDGEATGAPLQGQTVLYFGPNGQRFRDVFSELFGPVTPGVWRDD